MPKSSTTVLCVLYLSLASAALADQGLSLDSSYQVPKVYQSTQASAKDHTVDDAPIARYRSAYEAFWWNCAAVKAESLDNRCPFIANGCPAETAGASDGALKASNDIVGLLKKYDAAAVQVYLRRLTSPSIAIAKLEGRFKEPTADPNGF